MALNENTFKIFDLLIKGVFGVAITAAITLFSIRAETHRQEIAQQNIRQNAMIEFISKQKDLDISQGMRMFENLMTNYLERGTSLKSPENIREKMVQLRLIALNFQDNPINLKPLYQQLDRTITDSKDKENLRGIAQEVARRQAYRLTSKVGLDLELKLVKPGGKKAMPGLPVMISIDEISKDNIVARLIINEGASNERIVGPFAVTFFDMPLVDNTKIGEFRVSLILLNCYEESADVRAIAFENHLAMDRFDVKELTNRYRGEDWGNK
jgi:hypothetical protein